MIVMGNTWSKLKTRWYNEWLHTGKGRGYFITTMHGYTHRQYKKQVIK